MSIVPGVLVIMLLIFGVPATTPSLTTQPAQRLAWGTLDHRLRGLILSAGGLAFAAAPEVFLVLWAQANGLAIVWIPLLWAAAHAVKSAIAIPMGGLSDRVGRLPVVITGWCVRVLILILLAINNDSLVMVWFLFLAYAAALASTEGAERAMIGDYAPREQKATAFGLYHMLTGILALPGALLFGAVWQWFGMIPAFLTAAALTTLSAILLLSQYRENK